MAPRRHLLRRRKLQPPPLLRLALLLAAAWAGARAACAMCAAPSTNQLDLAAEAAALDRLRAAGYAISPGSALEVVHCHADEYDWMSNGYAMTYADVDDDDVGSTCGGDDADNSDGSPGPGPGGGRWGRRRVRVLSYAPGQTVRAHVHDSAAAFKVTSGAMLLQLWPLMEPADLLPFIRAAGQEAAATPTGGGGSRVATQQRQQQRTHRLPALGAPEAARWFWPGERVTVPAGVPHAATAHPSLGATVHELAGNFTSRATVFAERGDIDSSPAAVLPPHQQH